MSLPLRRRLRQALAACTAPPTVSRAGALALSERLSAVTHLVAGLEYLRAPEDREFGGCNDWTVLREAYRNWPAPLRRAMELVGDRRTTKALHLARIGAAAALLTPLRGRGRVVAGAVLSGTSLVLYPRHIYGTDGADQVSALVSTVTTVARAGERHPELVDACLWFVSAQSVLSYAVSGWVKVTSRTWRSGEALPGIMRTHSYGDREVWELTKRHPRAAHALGSAVLALECAFPAVFLLGGRPAPAMVGSALAFHGVNARVMGLGRFLWSFASMHPAVLYTAGPRRRADGAVRHDTFPLVAAGVLGAGWAAALAAAARRRRVVERGWGDEESITTSTGSRLAFRRRAQAGEGRPVLVLESGLAAPAELWEWLAAALAERYTVVTYQRAGLGRSRYTRPADEFRLADAAGDLAELVKHVCGDRPAVLVGHSLGGYLAALAAERLPGHVGAVCLLDSSHPGELRRSDRQAKGEAQLTALMTQVPPSLGLGLGSLLRKPDWAAHLPGPVRAQAQAQYRDRRLWAAAHREWRAVVREFRGHDGSLPRLGVPLLVVTAGRSAQKDPVQLDLQREFAGSAASARFHVLDGADHNEILGHPQAAARVAALVAAFVAEQVEGSGDEQAH
ncbi:alpha/beta fold hydrolase [Kitasatospora sp. NPDC058965]|uniref:alpha/beta fold hydrolase n=1 Tax=Kitasatospora sp. NPDC058965 TaxID=3346682 RepID=UPI00368C28C4